MNIWCPQCGSTKFFNDKLAEYSATNMNVIKDHMKCKNNSCGYEFNIDWSEDTRSEWIRENAVYRPKFINRKHNT